jgi:hypothetical protein
MINPGNGSKWGIKISGEDLTEDIHSIINNAQQFVIVCGYNFSPYTDPTSIIPRLIHKRNLNVDVLIIMPPKMWGFGNLNHTNNLDYLINQGIGVILNSNNHSKWIVSDYGYYYGSLNFSSASMTTKVEVVSFCDVLQDGRPTWWMRETKKELLVFASNELNNFHRRRLTINLGAVNIASLRILQNAIQRILRYNPDIERVRNTLLYYEEVRLSLSTIIDSYFTRISMSQLDRIWELIDNSITSLDRLAYIGNDILLNSITQPIDAPSNLEYNRIHERFIDQVQSLIKTIGSDYLELSVQEKAVDLITSLQYKLDDYLKKDNMG